MRSAILCALLSLLLGPARSIDPPPIVSTNFGQLRGKWMTTASNTPVASYLGIPYAAPPIGELRLENTRPWSKIWNGIRDATVDGPMCPQWGLNGALEGSEDCLHLNIYVPYNQTDTSAVRRGERLPVLVFVHGGGYVIGSNNSTKIGPEYIMDQDVILAVVNYRLDVLGFFSTGNDIAPGNYGVKDVVMALRWIQSNIGGFGGDSGSVTLHGYSAGAVITHLLALSEKTKGLFHRIITQSGSAVASWAFHTQPNIRISSLSLAHLVGCVDDPESIHSYISNSNRQARLRQDRVIKDCMKSQKLEKLFVYNDFSNQSSNQPVVMLGPTVEADNEGAVITKHPLKSLEDATFQDIPWMTGTVVDEGLFKIFDLVRRENATEYISENLFEFLPQFLDAQEYIRDVVSFSDVIFDEYLINKEGPDLAKALAQVVTDGGFLWPNYEAITKQMKHMNSSIFVYVFAYEGSISMGMQQYFPMHYTVSHGDDMVYLFPRINPRFDSAMTQTSGDRTMSHILVEMITNFAKNGVPSAYLTVDWEPYAEEDHKFIRLGTERSPYATMERGYFADKMGLWKELINNVTLPLKELADLDWTQEHYLSATAAVASPAEHVVIPLFFTCFIIVYWLRHFLTPSFN